MASDNPPPIDLNVIALSYHLGGMTRFAVQLMRALQDSGAIRRLRFVSHGSALDLHREILKSHGVECEFLDVPPAMSPSLGSGCFSVRREAYEGCNVAWVPVLHYHTVPRAMSFRTVGSFHDAMYDKVPQLVASAPAWVVEFQHEITQQWLDSKAVVVCSSRFWFQHLDAHFDIRESNVRLIPVTGGHKVPPLVSPPGREWPWFSKPYLLCPANLSAHKNHETLLEGYAKSGVHWPLVLTGNGSDFRDPRPFARRIGRRLFVALGRRRPDRPAVVRALASKLGLPIGKKLIPLGYIDEASYEAILGHAAAVVMPTLGEGGGSFPAEEAILHGVPVICSDIPVLREQMERIGADVMWFDPHSSDALAERMRWVAAHHDEAKAAACAQISSLRSRSWSDVAAEYLDLFRSIAARPETGRSDIALTR